MRATHTLTVDGDRGVVRLRGDVDMAVADDVVDWLREAVDSTGTVLDVDLAETQFLDSTGITSLVRARQYAESRGVAMRCVNTQPWVARVFHIAGVAEYLDVR